MTDEGKAESCRTLTELPELPCELLRVVAVGTGIAIHEVALEHVIHEDGRLARRGRDCLQFPGAGGQSAVEGPERRRVRPRLAAASRNAVAARLAEGCVCELSSLPPDTFCSWGRASTTT